MLPQEIIRKKRDGHTLSDGEISAFIAGLTNGDVTDAQAAAFAMAVFFRGMTMAERVALTKSMMISGHQLQWNDKSASAFDTHGPILDKHSTGGIGDNVSLMLAPAVAACGGYVPMISGRGLGHTGGTLDKLDAIPGYVTQPDIALFRKVVRETGAAIIGQTADLAPADKKLYAIRDVTATVESIPLITASILSKKLAAGLQGLVMDVKTGSGAFMPTLEGSRELAQSLADVATGAGLPTTALITEMDEPLASAAGNALEVQNAVHYLDGTHRDARLHKVVVALGAEMLLIGGLVATLDEGVTKLENAIASGAAAERFQRMVTALGGPSDFMAKTESYLPRAPVIRAVAADASGFVHSIATREIGLAVVSLGGGRTRAEDRIDPSVGLTKLLSVGTRVEKGEPLAFVHAANETDAEKAAAMIRTAYTIGATAPEPRPLIHDRLVGRKG
jgi:thymidine phosphorylase